MPLALCVDIADAMVDLIGAADFGQAFTVERQWVETQRLEDIDVDDPAKIIVVPQTLNLQAFDLKPRIENRWGIGVWIDKVVQQTNAGIDPVAYLVEQVVNLLATNRTLDIINPPFRATCVGIAPEPSYDTMQLLDIKVFRSVFVATYRVIF